MINPFLMAGLLGLKHALDPDHLAAVFNMTVSGKSDTKSAAKLGWSWGIGHAMSMVMLGLPVVLFSSALPEWVYSSAELVVGLVIIYLGLQLFVQWFKGNFHPHAIIKRTPSHDDHKKSHRRAGMVGALHGVGGSYPASLLMLASFSTPTSAVVGLIGFTALSIISMVSVTTIFSYIAMHHLFVHVLDRIFIPILVVSTCVFGVFYVLEALKALGFV